MSLWLSSAVAAVMILAGFWMKVFKLSDVKLLAVVYAFLKLQFRATSTPHYPFCHETLEEVKAHRFHRKKTVATDCFATYKSQPSALAAVVPSVPSVANTLRERDGLSERPETFAEMSDDGNACGSHL